MWILKPLIGRPAVSIPKFEVENPSKKELLDSLGRLGSLEVRLARGKKEIRKAQHLRYEVFYKEGGAIPSARAAITKRDADHFDKYCDHLIVIDHAWKTKFGKTKPKIVGAYRLLRSDMARKAGGFYSASEYDIEPLLARHAGKRFLELGRSCVLKSHRSKRTIDLLWRGLLAYVRAHRIDVMIGCASLPGAAPFVHAHALSYLAHHARASSEWDVKAKSDLYVHMTIVAKEKLDEQRGRDALSPLIKGYLRVGARFGDGAVVDTKFNTTDVFVVMPICEISARYIDHFSRADREAA